MVNKDAYDEFHTGLMVLVEKALNSGVSINAVVGDLELMKTLMINKSFEKIIKNFTPDEDAAIQ